MFRRLTILLALLASCLTAAAARPGFVLWQLPPQGASQMNSYVLQTDRGRVVVIDGGTAEDAPYLRGFLAALGNRVEAWFVTHPHADHMGALTQLLRQPGDLQIGCVYQSPMTDEQLATDDNRRKSAEEYFGVLAASGVTVENLTRPGLELRIDGLRLKVLQVCATCTAIISSSRITDNRACANRSTARSASGRASGRHPSGFGTTTWAEAATPPGFKPCSPAHGSTGWVSASTTAPGRALCASNKRTTKIQ